MRAQVGLFLTIALGAAACGGASATPTPSPTIRATQAPVVTPVPTAIEVATPEPTPAPTENIYVVVKGDNLSRIATRFHITLAALRAANPQITNPDVVQIGQQLVIPTP